MKARITDEDRNLLRLMMQPPAQCRDVSEWALQLLANYRERAEKVSIYRSLQNKPKK